jgi:hypothetical protein
MERSWLSITSRVALSSALVGWAVCVVGVPETAAADTKADVALNGTFTAFSNGQYAKTNDRFHDEESVTSTWAITTTCSTYTECSGHVTSDQGWTAPVTYISPMWFVVRTIDGWEHCADGTTAPGTQTFKFFLDQQFNPTNLKGWDNTLNESGSCGINKVLNIELPFTLTPVG